MNEEIYIFNYFSTTPLKLIAAIIIMLVLAIAVTHLHFRWKLIRYRRKIRKLADNAFEEYMDIRCKQHTDI